MSDAGDKAGGGDNAAGGKTTKKGKSAKQAVGFTAVDPKVLAAAGRVQKALEGLTGAELKKATEMALAPMGLRVIPMDRPIMTLRANAGASTSTGSSANAGTVKAAKAAKSGSTQKVDTARLKADPRFPGLQASLSAANAALKGKKKEDPDYGALEAAQKVAWDAMSVLRKEFPLGK